MNATTIKKLQFSLLLKFTPGFKYSYFQGEFDFQVKNLQFSKN